jgi:5-formyltetrahydrofolate cyclo-ligase
MFDDETIGRTVKAELRKRMRGLRTTLGAAACLARSERIVATLLALPELEAAQHVAVFYPIEARHEVDLRALDAALRARGIFVYYPSIDPVTRDMTFRLVTDLESLEEQGLGFREPAASAPVATALDVVVVPCLAADPTGYRLGYGAGFYDRTLPAFCPPAFAVAVAFDFQLLAEIPKSALDVPVAAVVTDTRTLRIPTA